MARIQAEHDSYVKELVDYDDVAAEYARYSTGWMTDTERNRVDRNRILEIVEEEIFPKCTVTGLNITENTVTVDVTECTLSTVSDMVAKLYEVEEVVSVKMSSASSEDNTSEKLDGATIIFTVTPIGGDQ